MDEDDELPTVQKAAVIRHPGPNASIVVQHNVPVGTPGPHEVLVRISATGVWYIFSCSCCMTFIADLNSGKRIGDSSFPGLGCVRPHRRP